MVTDLNRQPLQVASAYHQTLRPDTHTHTSHYFQAFVSRYGCGLMLASTLGTQHPAAAPSTQSDAPNNRSTFFAVNKCSQLNISITIMIHFDFLSDLSSGRRPMSKSDEKSKCIIIVIEIWRCENFSFAVHRYSLSEHDSPLKYIHIVASLNASVVNCFSYRVHVYRTEQRN